MEDFIEYLGAYLIGSIPAAFLLKKGKVGKRSFGIIKAVLDILKGFAAVSLARALSPADQPDWVLAGFLALVGDEFPIFSKFKGVRGRGTSLGVFAALLFWMLIK
jgi:acyl phosphate:glycerol-3-phosphate acyltransferase